MTVCNDAGAHAPVNTATRLRTLADRLPELGPDGEWLAAGLRRYLNDACHGGTLDAALGLAAGAGQRRWYQAEMMARRDALIRRMAEFHPDKSRRQQAFAIAQDAARYQAAGWRFHQGRDAMPPELDGTMRGLIWEALRTGIPFPESPRQLQSILSAGDAV